MRIAEIFSSIQGEGRFAGTSSVFVRTTGCNLRCWFCDTRYASWEPEGAQADWKSVVEQVLVHDCEHVVITGGEPFLQRDLVPLTEALQAAGRFITIETAGTFYRPVHADLLSISPKRPGSNPDPLLAGRWTARHEARRDNREVLRRLLSEYPHQLKFVIDRATDLDDLDEYLNALPEICRDHVWLMPQAITSAAAQAQSSWLEPRAKELGFHFSPRLHIEWWGNVRGK